MKEKKTIIITSVVLGVLVLILGVAYAAFNYTKLGITSKLIVGDIYMHYDENTTGINLTNALPTKTYDETNYFEFTIDGKNTYDKKDIYYELLLNLGDPVSGKTRIKDELLKFTLTRKNTDGTWETIIDSRSYETINNTKLFVETIPKNTTSEIVHTYRLYMWISNDVVICDGNKPDNCDYTLDEWKDIYASIKLDADGDFQEKTFYVSDPSCFGTKETDDGTLTIMYGKTASPEKPDICDGTDIIIPSEINGIKITRIHADAFNNNRLTSVVIPEGITEIWPHAFANNQLTSVVIPNSVTEISVGVFENNQLTNITIPDSVTTISNEAFKNNQLTNVVIPNSVITIDDGAFENNQLTSVTIPDSVTTIDIQAFNNNKLPDTQAFIYKRVDTNNDGIAEIDKTTIIGYGGANKKPVIPDNVIVINQRAFADSELTSVTISNSVTTIGSSAFSNNQLTSITMPNSVTTIGSSAFSNNQLTSITIPNSVTTIGEYAFLDNQLTSVTIPNSVTTIGEYAFFNNQLKLITIGNGIMYIGLNAFLKNSYSNPNLSKITIDKSCTYIKYIYGDSFDKNGYYPWLSTRSPYTASGVTIYGSNNEICDSY